MKKSTLIIMLVSEIILLLILGIVGSRIAALEGFSPAVLFGLALVSVVGLTYISYWKLTRPILDSTARTKRQPNEFSNRILKYFQKRTTYGPDNFESVMKKSFALSAAGTFIVFLAARYIFKGSLLFFLTGYFLVTVGGAWTFLRAPTNTRYQLFSDVVEEVLGLLFMTGVIFALPGLFAGYGVMWLLSYVLQR